MNRTISLNFPLIDRISSASFTQDTKVLNLSSELVLIG
jgi:hypothetical protein